MMPRVLIILTLIGSLASAQTVTAAQHVQAGQQAFDKGDYVAAYAEYEAAFAIDSSPENALRMVIAAGYGTDLASSGKMVGTWMLKKREDAQRHGDTDVSWKMIESVAKAIHYGVAEKDRQIEQLQKQVADLQKQIVTQHEFVDSLQENHAEQVAKLRRDYEGQLDRLRANRSVP